MAIRMLPAADLSFDLPFSSHMDTPVSGDARPASLPRSVRAALRLPCDKELTLRLADDTLLPGRVADISATGFSFLTVDPLRDTLADAQVDLIVDLLGERLELPCVVVRITPA
ncbi:MAG: PilZ domain-containing protein, partial [Magnetococcales bacterium]|nr:PilZ domain-containing protein [Magnetococcales bacterium]